MCPLQTKGACKGDLLYLLAPSCDTPRACNWAGLLDTNSDSVPLGAEPCRGTEVKVLDPGRCGGAPQWSLRSFPGLHLLP